MFWRPRNTEPSFRAIDTVSPGMRIAAAWSWRFVAVAAAVGVVIWLVMQFSLIVIPLFIAVLLAALLGPYSGWLSRRLKFPRWLAVLTAMLTLVGVVTGLVWLVVAQVRAGWEDVRDRGLERWDELLVWLDSLGFSADEITGYIDSILGELDLSTNGPLVSGALSVGGTAIEILTGSVLVLFALIFLLLDGRGIWRFVVRLFPSRARSAVDGAGQAGWLTLTSFAKVQIFVASVDAVGIGLIAFFLGVPLALPIAVAVFLASFVPFVGAIVSGALAVLVALAYNGPGIALAMLAGVLVVQQVEGNILQPLVMGPAVRVHPLAVVLAVTAGGLLAGIPGTLFAVPIIAFLNVVVRYIARGQWRTTPQPKLGDILREPPEAQKEQA